MPLQVPEANRTRQKDFNGIRRTKEGMLYLTHVVREQVVIQLKFQSFLKTENLIYYQKTVKQITHIKD